jgi:hypothetical protein
MSARTSILLVALLTMPARLLAAEDPIEGTWVLNLSKSKIVGKSPGTIYTYIIDAKTGRRIVHGEIGANGQSYIRIEEMNGKPYPYTVNPLYDQAANRRPDPYTLTGAFLMKGKVRTTFTHFYSKDGKEFTDPLGPETLEADSGQIRVFDKIVADRPAAEEPFAGTWFLNAAKSKFDPGPPPKSLIYTYIPYGKDGGLKVHGNNPAAKPMAGSYIRTETMDGKPYPNTTNMLLAFDLDHQEAVSRPDLYTITGKFLMKGNLISTFTRVVSKDRKTMTIAAKGTRNGKPFNDIKVFDKIDAESVRSYPPGELYHWK